MRDLNKIWTTKDFEEMVVADLTDSHIINILKYFNTKIVDPERFEELTNVVEEAESRGITEPCIFYEDSWAVTDNPFLPQNKGD